MIEILMFAFAFAMFQGWINGGRAMRKVKKNPSLGVKPSRNCGSFVFIDIN